MYYNINILKINLIEGKFGIPGVGGSVDFYVIFLHEQNSLITAMSEYIYIYYVKK